MNKIHHYVFGLVIVIFAGSARAEAEPEVAAAEKRYGEITAARLNIRAKPGTKYEVIGQLPEGRIVEIATELEDWVGIYAPPKTEAWIASNQIDDGVVVADNVPVYSGPGTIFTAYHYLSKGEVVTPHKSLDDKWVRIAPDPDSVVWVHKDFVRLNYEEYYEMGDIPGSESAGGHETNRDGRSASAASSTIPDDKIDPLPFGPLYNNITFIGEVKEVEKRGFVVALGRDHEPFRYALAVGISDTYFPLGYLSHRSSDMAEWEGKKVAVVGHQQWMKGRPRPLIRIKSIGELTEE